MTGDEEFMAGGPWHRMSEQLLKLPLVVCRQSSGDQRYHNFMAVSCCLRATGRRMGFTEVQCREGGLSITDRVCRVLGAAEANPPCPQQRAGGVHGAGPQDGREAECPAYSCLPYQSACCFGDAIPEEG